MRILIFSLFSIILFTSCTKGNLAYLSDLEDQAFFDADSISEYEPKIQRGDMLSVTMSSLSPESNALFNSGMLFMSSSNKNQVAGSSFSEGYLVDKNGYATFPIIGKVQLAGSTKEEAIENITIALKKYAKEPIISIKITNFKVTIIGEVNKPSTIIVPAERLNILEALGYAGDMTPFGKRDNVLVIRDVNGARSTVRVNLHSKDLLTSPYYNLQQNDIIYVEPNRAKVLQSSTRTYNLPIWLSAASILAFVISTFI